jgi:hypothetical protein
MLYIRTVECPKTVSNMVLDPKRLIDRSITDLIDSLIPRASGRSQCSYRWF